MPGHFTHIYTARRVADLLDDLGAKGFDPAGSLLETVADGLSPADCAAVMKTWDRFTALGAVGPDLFFFSQDYSSGPLAAAPYQDDVLMLAAAVYYFVDAAKEDDWEPLLLLLAEIDGTFAGIVRILIQIKKAIDEFVAVYDATIKKFVDGVVTVLDDLTGGLIEEFTTAIQNLGAALIGIIEQELVTFGDIFSWFSLKMRQGWDEQAFVWSDMLHYRRTSQMAANLLVEAKRQKDAGGTQDHYDQFLAYILGWCCHIGTDVVAHSFVNEQCGGPFRTHYQRHHLIENHIDAHNYRETAPGKALTPDPIGYADDFPDIDSSALVFAVALDDTHPHGWPRPASLPSDPAAAKKALDVDGEMPDWLADGIVRAMIATYHTRDPQQPDPEHPEPANLGGKPFQDGIDTTHGAVQLLLDAAGISIDRPLGELIGLVAPTPDFDVPAGYPLPWEVKFCYRFMISFYKLSFSQGFDVPKPRTPQVVIWPPAADFTDLASAPDFSGPSSGDPVEDLCNAIKSILDWLKKEVEAAVKLAGDLIKMLASPASYPLRAGLHELAMIGWNMATTAHEILAHTGFVYPHGERRYDDGELRMPNEIDLALVTLGSTVDAAFAKALADATDPFAGLDLGTDLLGEQRDPLFPFPFLPVRATQNASESPNEFHRPWAFPSKSRNSAKKLVDTPLELWDVGAELTRLNIPEDQRAVVERLLGNGLGLTTPGPFRAGATPEVLLKTDLVGDPRERPQYEAAFSPVVTDVLNRRNIVEADGDVNPLGDPIPFSCYLIGRILSTDGYPVDFNLDADRGFAYLCWDWNRDSASSWTNGRGQPYPVPEVPPEGSTKDLSGRDWPGAAPDGTQVPVRLHYIDRKPPDRFGTHTHGPQPFGPRP